MKGREVLPMGVNWVMGVNQRVGAFLQQLQGNVSEGFLGLATHIFA